MEISSDFKDLLYAFNVADAEYLVIGAVAVGFHDAPRATADFDVPSFRIDVLTSVDGVAFSDAWSRRVSGTLGDVPVWFIGRDDLIANKIAAGRGKDLLAVERLRKRLS